MLISPPLKNEYHKIMDMACILPKTNKMKSAIYAEQVSLLVVQR